MSIKIREIKEAECELRDPNNNLVGIIKSYLQMDDVRIQIMKQELSGYRIIWKDDGVDKEIKINKYGHLSSYPRGLYDLYDRQLDQLLNLK